MVEFQITLRTNKCDRLLDREFRHGWAVGIGGAKDPASDQRRDHHRNRQQPTNDSLHIHTLPGDVL
jgi:hypothetical protein